MRLGREVQFFSRCLTREKEAQTRCLVFVPAGNDSTVDGLVNFEKLRMIAKEIRHVVRMTSANMDPALMFRQRWVLGLGFHSHPKTSLRRRDVHVTALR